MKQPDTVTTRRRQLVLVAAGLATDQNGVISRPQLRELGLTKADVRVEVRARRWRRHGTNTIAVHTAELDLRARWHSALFEITADAALDGVTALIAAGLRGYDEDLIHVSVPRGTHPNASPGVRVHETRRRQPTDIVGAGIPRTRPEVAAVRGALWARSNRQAALIIVMAVQQRITAGEAVQEALSTVRRDPRRRFLRAVVRDVVDGAQALSELDFARLCRDHGLPEPSRQVVRRGRNGRVYLDVYWDQWGIVVEIEGVHHGSGETQVADALRQNALSLDRELVLRIPVLGLRIRHAEFMDQLADAMRGRGCPVPRQKPPAGAREGAA